MVRSQEGWNLYDDIQVPLLDFANDHPVLIFIGGLTLIVLINYYGFSDDPTPKIKPPKDDTDGDSAPTSSLLPKIKKKPTLADYERVLPPEYHHLLHKKSEDEPINRPD